jgi:hypothetical protein
MRARAVPHTARICTHNAHNLTNLVTDFRRFRPFPVKTVEAPTTLVVAISATLLRLQLTSLQNTTSYVVIMPLCYLLARGMLNVLRYNATSDVANRSIMWAVCTQAN